MEEIPLEQARAEAHLAPDLSPEGRRRQALRWRAGLDEQVGKDTLLRIARFKRVVQRVWLGAWNDGFIHAGNLAYMAILAIFPFFITVAATTWLNFKHTIFGEVADQPSRDVVDAIAAVETGGQDRPKNNVVIESITINRS